MASIPPSVRLLPICCACSRPAADRIPGRHPVATPCSLSSVVECVSKTSSIVIAATAMPLVRIEVLKGRPASERKQLLDAVHDALVEAFRHPRGRPDPAPHRTRSGELSRPILDTRSGTRSSRSPRSPVARAKPSATSTPRSLGTSRRSGLLRTTSSSSFTSLRCRTGGSEAATRQTRSN